jgi:divalent metal cation (Fe/Co/Zn/Cd) transporter
MDGIEPELLDRAQSALSRTPGVLAVPALQLRWIGHRLQGNARIQVADTSISSGEAIIAQAHRSLGLALPNLDSMSISATTGPGLESAEVSVPGSLHRHG